jgi:hypothetical protein
MRSNNLESELEQYDFINPIVKAVHKDLLDCFEDCTDFTVFSAVDTVANRVSLLEHLDVFNPQ